MKAKSARQAGPGALELIEEVFHLLRMVPGALAYYYLGSLPFVLGLLYFWTDMSYSAFAEQRLPGGALGVALLFLWMKVWHVRYARALWAEVRGDAGPPWTLGRYARVAVRQTIVQPWGLVVLPVALFIMIPFPGVYAFYQNVTVLDDGDSTGVQDLGRRAAALARPWPTQNLVLIWALSPYLMVTAAALYLVLMPLMKALSPEWSPVFLGIYAVMYGLAVMPLSPFGVVIAANIGSAILAVPVLIKMFLGIQTAAIQSQGSLFGTTFLAVVCALTYLCMDPLMKAAYVLRCFYTESLTTGEDLRVELRRFTRTMACLLIASGCLLTGICHAQPADDTTAETSASADPQPETRNPEPGTRSISVPGLNIALDRELQHRMYSWRLPRQPVPRDQEGYLMGKLRAIYEIVREKLGKARDWINEKLDQLGRYFRGGTGGQASSSWDFDVFFLLRLLLCALAGALAALIGVLLWRAWRQRRATVAATQVSLVAATPDIRDENTSADSLPEAGWMALARELAAQGEVRLALRAVFLASLAFLAEHGLIHIARYKSNRDYRTELSRRAHALPEVPPLFASNVAVYESVWYGAHEATSILFDDVIANQQRVASLIAGRREGPGSHA